MSKWAQRRLRQLPGRMIGLGVLSTWLAIISNVSFTTAFTLLPQQVHRAIPQQESRRLSYPSALGVTFFGGSPLDFSQQSSQRQQQSTNTDRNNVYELQPVVRIERTSANSRKIMGDIVAPNLSLMDVWAILTDYNRLATHVPNLVESRIVSSNASNNAMGDGNFRCRLFQKGAQKIVGFEFGASVTMDMVEEVIRNGGATAAGSSIAESSQPGDERRITFKCVDSFFFQEFDGEWRVKERLNNKTGKPETVISYSVDVRPRGPVPVAALEWRIREDVPTNLLAVKRAAEEVGYAGVQASKGRSQLMSTNNNSSKRNPWDVEETMAAYLRD